MNKVTLGSLSCKTHPYGGDVEQISNEFLDGILIVVVVYYYRVVEVATMRHRLYRTTECATWEVSIERRR
ncbi:hypothetical protein TYRP_021464, partial [Tyrophagus putrescentiae]